MSRTRFLSRTFCAVVWTLPLAALSACGSAFTPSATGDDASTPTEEAGSEDAPEEDVVIVVHAPDASTHDAADAGEAHDATVDAPGDAPGDGPSVMEAGGCPTGDLTCGGLCVPNDVKNCGTCGNDCTNLPHVSGMVSCTSGGMCSFQASACAPGWADCNGNPDDGCETDITKPGHCGSCSTMCTASDPVCQGSGSTYTCVTGCSGSTPTLCNGSCVNTTTDPNNCGGCAMGATHVCTGAPKNAQNTCVNSTCSYSCNSGYLSCAGACMVSTVDQTHGVFVAQGGGTAPSCGTVLAPCGTLTAALTVVSQSVGAKQIIYVDDKSTLTEPGPVTLLGGVTVQGGWVDNAGVWTAECNPTQLPVIQPASGNVTIDASYSGTSTLIDLTLESKSTANAGESLYGVFASGPSTKLTLQNVGVVVAAGGAGTTGSTGGSGTDGSTAGCSMSGTGANGASVGAGAAGAASYSSSGFTPKAAGKGPDGNTGDYGTAPGAPQCGYGCTTSCTWVSGDAMCEGCSGATIQICGGAGLSGCPGTGSGGGQPGTSAGASIGIFSYGASVTVTNGVVKTGAGGKGGSGGLAGSTVGAGAAGVAGGSACANKGCSGTSPTTCKLGGCTQTVSGGSAGGTGGSGGPGGQGGGGAGGDSYCVVYGGSGSVSAPGLSCTSSSGGQGGSPNGPSGQSGTTKTF